MLDCNLESVNKGLEAIKLFHQVLEEYSHLKPYVYDIQVHCGVPEEEGAHMVGVWSYFDNESFQFEEK